MKIERLIEQAREELITDIVLSDEFMNRMQENFLPIERLMSYYRCAIMEVETKFRVLNEQFSLQYDRNPIETIKTRVKSFDGILKKVKRKQIPFSLESIEENINDIAGVRVVCSFPEDIYLLAECLLQQDDIRLIEKKDLLKTAIPEDDSLLVEEEKKHERHTSMYPAAVFQLIIAIGIGTIISKFLSMTGMTFPIYIGAMIAAACMRNIGEYSGKFTIYMGEINDIGGISLSLFLGIAMITLKLWQLADLALPLITLLAGQTILMFLFTY
mgnify:CR=1 FL=1